MARHSEADNYYNDQSVCQRHLQPTQAQQYQQPLQIQYQSPAHLPPRSYGEHTYGGKSRQPYSEAPPTYGATFVPPQTNKQDFQQTFKIAKPKWNDLWAGILVRWDPRLRFQDQCRLMSSLSAANHCLPWLRRRLWAHIVSLLEVQRVQWRWYLQCGQ